MYVCNNVYAYVVFYESTLGLIRTRTHTHIHICKSTKQPDTFHTFSHFEYSEYSVLLAQILIVLSPHLFTMNRHKKLMRNFLTKAESCQLRHVGGCCRNSQMESREGFARDQNDDDGKLTVIVTLTWLSTELIAEMRLRRQSGGWTGNEWKWA